MSGGGIIGEKDAPLSITYLSDGETPQALKIQRSDAVTVRFLTYDPSRVDRWRSWLREDERACLQSFGHPKRREEYVTGRAALRMLLAERLDSNPAEMELRTAEDGAVEAPGTGMHASLAHCDEHAIAVLADHPIGVDLERIQPRREDLYRFLLHPEEYDLLDALPLGRDDLHVLCWTIKEATLKGLRTGFRLSPKKLRLDIDFEGGEALVTVEEGRPWRVQFRECSLGDGEATYYWSVATPERIHQPER